MPLFQWGESFFLATKQFFRHSPSEHLKAYWPFLLFGITSLIVLWPLLGRGYVLQYDMVFVPHPQLDWHAVQSGSALYLSVPLGLFLMAISHVIAIDIFQKIVLVAVLLGAMLSMYRLLLPFYRPARVIGALFYALNPFTLDRLLAGHWALLAAYALMPLFVVTLYSLGTDPTARRLVKVALVWTVLTLLSPHHLVIAGFVYFGFVVFGKRTKRAGLFLGILPLAVLILNSWWIIPLLFGHNYTHGFGVNDWYVFATRTDTRFGIWLNMLALQGFWRHGWRTAADMYRFWPFLVFLWLVPVFIGLGSVAAATNRYRHLIGGLLVAAGLALIIASGPAPPFGSSNLWLFLHVPGFSGLREPEKLLSVLALAYAVLSAYGIDALMRRYRRASVAYIVFAAMTIAILVWPFAGAAHGQLQSVSYPRSWKALYTQLYQSPAKQYPRVVIIPRQLYIDKSFAGSLVANPANSYFGDKAIPSQQAGLSGILDYATPSYKDLELALIQHDAVGLRLSMEKLHASYLILTKSEDDTTYQWLYSQPSFRVLSDSDKTTIWHLTKRLR